ncbi:unnamed protein product [Gadus morhua 'NCC']
MTTVIPPNPSLNPVNANASAALRSLRQFPVLLAGGGRPLELVKGRTGVPTASPRRPHGVPTASPRRPHGVPTASSKPTAVQRCCPRQRDPGDRESGPRLYQLPKAPSTLHFLTGNERQIAFSCPQPSEKTPEATGRHSARRKRLGLARSNLVQPYPGLAGCQRRRSGNWATGLRYVTACCRVEGYLDRQVQCYLDRQVQCYLDRQVQCYLDRSSVTWTGDIPRIPGSTGGQRGPSGAPDCGNRL